MARSTSSAESIEANDQAAKFSPIRIKIMIVILRIIRGIQVLMILKPLTDDGCGFLQTFELGNTSVGFKYVSSSQPEGLLE